METLSKKIFQIHSDNDFERVALEVFRIQAAENPVYRSYLKHRGLTAASVTSLESIPFLPIELFRDHKVVTGKKEAVRVFESSGTTDQKPSRHYLISEKLYKQSFTTTFLERVKDPEKLCILALLPSYLERSGSSLVYMMEHLIKISKHPDSGFYLDNLMQLSEVLAKRNNDHHPTLLLGVSFALLDLAEQHPLSFRENIQIMETGGMKGRRKELVRDELHTKLKSAFGIDHIRSEYGMTELLSQAYTNKIGRFTPARWMKVFTRDTYDPFSFLPNGQRGAVNIIDLANLYSCSFIETSDLGIVHEDGSFEISGRLDQSEIRGCNLMVL